MFFFLGNMIKVCLNCRIKEDWIGQLRNVAVIDGLNAFKLPFH